MLPRKGRRKTGFHGAGSFKYLEITVRSRLGRSKGADKQPFFLIHDKQHLVDDGRGRHCEEGQN